jgi:alkylation response protein AidB-like acyl-CoA dehydrogenase
MVSAVYLGVAQAALAVAVDFAHTRQPTALGKPIATLESIQRRIGEAEFTLQGARAILYHTAQRYDREAATSNLGSQPPQSADTREPLNVDFGEALLVAKLTATNGAIKVVDDAMRVVGGTSMTHQTPLERYYRDVRAGLFHPPFDDSALPLLGRAVLNRER